MSSSKGKNIRLTHEAWQELRKVKFEHGKDTYTTTLQELFKAHKDNTKILKGDIRTKPPSDSGDTTSVPSGDKTVIISLDMHKKLIDLKNHYMLDHGYSARGPDAVSFSHVILELIKQFSS